MTNAGRGRGAGLSPLSLDWGAERGLKAGNTLRGTSRGVGLPLHPALVGSPVKLPPGVVSRPSREPCASSPRILRETAEARALSECIGSLEGHISGLEGEMRQALADHNTRIEGMLQDQRPRRHL